MGRDTGGSRPEGAGDAGDAGDAEPGDVFDGLTLDEDFVRGASIKEPSARAKMLAERWRNEPPAAQPFRAAPSTAVTARATGRARVRRGRLVAGVVAALLVCGLVAVVFAPARVKSLTGWAPSDAPDPSVAGPVRRPAIDRARPFAGSPAETYADGAAGIVLPAARPVGRFTQKEVAAALRQAKSYLVTSRLEPRVVFGGAVDPVLSVLDPLGPRGDAVATLDKPAEDNDPATYVTRFDPAGVEPVGSVVKVRGTVTYRAASRDELVVRTDHLIVYAVARRGEPRTAQRVVLRLVADFVTYRDLRTTAGKVWPGTTWHSAAGVECDSAGPFLEVAFDGSRTPLGRAEDPYAPEPVEAATKDDECTAVTRL